MDNFAAPRLFGDDYSFPQEGLEDADIVKHLGLVQPLDTVELKAPQLLARRFGQRHKRWVLSFEKGMGKTILYELVGLETDPEQLLIVCRMNAFLAQRREILEHFPEYGDRFVFVQGQRPKRHRIWTNKEGQHKIFIVSPQTLMADMGLRTGSREDITPSWVSNPDFMICDEFHRFLRTRKSTFFSSMKGKRPRLNPERLILASGSAASKGPQDLWPALHTCSTVFSSFWRYVETFCEVDEGRWGREIGDCKNITGWRNSVSPYIFHRMKDAKDYPSKTRQALEVEMSSQEQQLQKKLASELMAEIDGELITLANSAAATMKLRQAMICPKVLSPSLPFGSGLEAIYEDVQDSELSHFVISTPFRAPIPFIEEFFQMKDIWTERLMGGDGVDADEMEARIRRWTVKGGLMIQTIDFAESYELPAANVMYMLGYKHDPEANKQAEDRINRDKRVTPRPSHIMYVKYLNSYDEEILDALIRHSDNVYDLLNRPLSEVFKFWKA